MRTSLASDLESYEEIPRPPARHFFTAAFVLLICGIILTGSVLKWRAADTSASGAEGKQAEEPGNAFTTQRKERENVVTSYRSQDDGRTLKLSMNEVAMFDADGKDRIMRLNPPATPATLAKRIAELDSPMGVMPVG